MRRNGPACPGQVRYPVTMVALREAHIRASFVVVLVIVVLIALHLIAIHGHADATALEVCMAFLVTVGAALQAALLCQDRHAGSSAPTASLRIESVLGVQMWVPPNSGMVMRH